MDVGVRAAPSRRPVGVFLATIPCYVNPSTAIEANDGGSTLPACLELFPPRLRLVSNCSDRAATCWVSDRKSIYARSHRLFPFIRLFRRRS